MLRAVPTFKVLALLSLSTSVCLSCGGADSPFGPPRLKTPLMEVRYLATLSAQQQSLVAAAADKWTRALSKNLGDFQLTSAANYCFSGEPQLNESHHNLLLFVSVADLDGTGGQLAYTQICSVSGQDGLPILSHIRLDRADIEAMEAAGTLAGVITHEMGHALGFNPKTYIPTGLASGTDDPYFSGATARSEFAMHGAWYTGVTVPLENSAGLGPNDPHWRYIVFGDELMVAAVRADYKSPLSVITLGLFKDLGYNVDFSVADPYEVVPLFGGNRLAPEGTLANDFRVLAPPTVIGPLVLH